MKRLPTSLALVGLAAALAGHALAAGDMADMKGIPMATSAGKTGHATGVVTGLDATAGAVTIKHGPIPAIGWPAMTMTFNATPASLLKGVSAGDTVKVRGQDNEVTSIHKQ